MCVCGPGDDEMRLISIGLLQRKRYSNSCMSVFHQLHSLGTIVLVAAVLRPLAQNLYT